MRPVKAAPWYSRPFLRLALAATAVSCLAAFGVAAADGQGAADLLKVRLGGDSREARIVIELDKTASGKMITSDKPGRRILLALPHVDTAGDMAGQGEGLVQSWAVDSVAGSARLKLDLRKNAVVKRRFLLPPGDGLNVYRYVIDVSEADSSGRPTAPPATARAGPEPGLGAASSGAANSGAFNSGASAWAALNGTNREDGDRVAKAAEPVVFPASNGKKVVVIDAGHGGRDSGALGALTKEKDDALAAAHVLKERLQRSGRYTVVMTRDTDAYIPLATRVQIARRANADLFISLHADSIGTLGAATRGASVYTLSERGADRTAKGVFGRSDWFMNVNLPGQDSETKRILLDLTQRQNVNRSSTFAELLLDRIGPVTPLLARSHRDANLMVLLAPDVPAVLLEMGFITNPQDEADLADPERRARLMDAVAGAIDDYFAEESRYEIR